MYKEPLVTVAVLSHNLEGYIGHSLKTVNKQTYKNMDIVILDDASSDDTMSEINHWAARDDRMRVIKNNKRKGVAAVRNQALNQIRGKYFIFVDGMTNWRHHLSKRWSVPWKEILMSASRASALAGVLVVRRRRLTRLSSERLIALVCLKA